MRQELIVKSKTLAGASDLTLLAPIIPGLVPSLDSISYKTRIKRLLKTLNAGRSSSHEYSLLRPFSDAVERVAKIHSFRVAVLEPSNMVLLAVTFDGTWEAYIRVLWQKVGTLLDVIFCNTVGYVSAYDNSFEAWTGWVHKVQIESHFFFATHALSVEDVHYLRRSESLHRREPGTAASDLQATRLISQTPEELAWELARHTSPDALVETGRQGLQALSFLYRLSSMYVPGEPDGKFLHRAARDILLEFVRLAGTPNLIDDFILGGRKRFDEQLTWLLTAPKDERVPPALPTMRPTYDATDVQGGIVTSYTKVTHGCLLMLAFASPDAAAGFLAALIPQITRDSTERKSESEVARNVTFTYEGLRALGLSEDQLAYFPQEFREGMESRTSMLGDFRSNHPRRWRLPVRHWPKPPKGDAVQVELTAIHAVLQLRVGGGDVRIESLDDASHPLHKPVQTLLAAHPGVTLLSVQPMLRYMNEAQQIVEHFGFADGSSDPTVDPDAAGKVYPNQIQLGELLLGHANQADPAAGPEPDEPESAANRRELMHNGSFLVVRKLRQDVEALFDAADAASASTGLKREDILGKMMGRMRNGNALAKPGAATNDFDYTEDPAGSRCPFHAHIRRANPRAVDAAELPSLPGGRTPRMVRRGMSYGPRYDVSDRASPVNRAERGMVFMAYNANISEQFEVVQRWLSGGNSTGGFSGHSDPFLGVPPNGEQRFFRFEDDAKSSPMPVHMALDGSPTPLAEPRPFVRLEWGAYLFTPSITALEKMQQIAAHAGSRPPPVWSVDRGLALLAQLREVDEAQGCDAASEAWKEVLEDHEAREKFITADLWAAIRATSGGVMRTPFGVLVANRQHVAQAFLDTPGNYTVSGYHDRMTQSIGEIYLGLDRPADAVEAARCPYEKQSVDTNHAIGKLTKAHAFERARHYAAETLGEMIAFEKAFALDTRRPRWELSLNAKEVSDVALEKLCQEWFGLPTGRDDELAPGASRWDWQDGEPPLYPGNFTAPSRYIFQPQPGETVERLGGLYGRTLTESMTALVQRHRTAHTVPHAPDTAATPTQRVKQGKPARLASAIFKAFAKSPDDVVARTMVGALMGFLPTVDGNFQLSLNEWLVDGSFWSLRQKLSAQAASHPSASPLANAIAVLEKPLIEVMQLRPSPELVWRTAKRHHDIGAVHVNPGDRVVVAIVSATHECLEQGSHDVYPVFGGNRSESPHPTHACPGYEAGMGVLLGILSALLEVREAMRPSPAPLAFTIDGESRTSTMAEPHPRSGPSSSASPPPAPPSGVSAPAARWLLAEGDSWFDYWQGKDLAKQLAETYHFRVAEVANPGDPLAYMATDPQLEAFEARLKRMVAQGNLPEAILLSGGGNDVVKMNLLPLIKPRGSGGYLDEPRVDHAIDGVLRTNLAAILRRYTQLSERYLGAAVPILLHGYDYPVPDGRNVFGVPSSLTSWLQPYLAEKGYTDVEESKKVMKKLIDRLNQMQIDVADSEGFQHVMHVDLRGTLSRNAADYRQDWANELHPTDAGFAKLAAAFAQALGWKPAPAAQS
ncbi:hypothetical protein BH11PSE8_BH11PSE8_26460 [soil metagenome]